MAFSCCAHDVAADMANPVPHAAAVAHGPVEYFLADGVANWGEHQCWFVSW